MGQSLEQQILSRSDYHRGLLIFIESNPGCTEEDIFNSPVANALIPISIRGQAIDLWVDKLIVDGSIQEKNGKLYSSKTAEWEGHNIKKENKLRRIIIESIANNTLSRDEELDLLFLIHDKKHVASYGEIIPGLEKAIKIYSTRCNGYLHRGVTGEEAKYIASSDVGDIIQNPGYSSFSRRPSIARKFAKSYQTEEMPIVLELDRGTKAFDYNSWIFNFWYNRMGTQLFWDNDAPDIMELAEEEQEWILPRNSKFEITKIRKAFKCLNFSVTLK